MIGLQRSPEVGAPPLEQAAGQALRVCMVHFSEFELDSRVQRQACSLASRGAEVICVCLSEPRELRVGRGVIRVEQVDIRKERTGMAGYLRGYSAFFAAALIKIAGLERRRHLDLVEIHNMPDFLTFAALVPKLRGTPVLLDVHDTFPELFVTKFGVAPDGLLSRAIHVEERLSAALADGLLVVTDAAGHRLNQRGVGLRKTAVVMNSPDEGVFGPPRAPVQLPEDGAVRIVYHGGVAPRFGVETLVRAFGAVSRQLPGASADIYGASPEESRTLAELASDLGLEGLRVAPKATPFGDIPAKLEGAHIGVVPTLRDDFTELLLPVKLLEYVHLGIPVVASRLPVIEQYFSDDELLFVEPGEPEALARGILDVCRDREAASERARRAGRRLEQISWRRQQERYFEMVDSLLARSNGHRRGVKTR